MLTFHDLTSGAQSVRPPVGAPLPASVAWIDASLPTDDDRVRIKDWLGIDLPPAERIAAIEPSNRLYRVGETLVLTVPVLPLDGGATSHTTPLAFIVAPEALVTLRYETAKALDAATGLEPHAAQSGGFGALVAVLGALVAGLADELEAQTATLNRYSATIFAMPKKGAPRPDLRPMIINLGMARAKGSQIGQCLSGLERLIAYLPSECGHGLSHESHQRLDLIAHDVASLDGHEGHLAEKIQFLLDSAVGLIGVEQNDIFKVLTIFSVVGIPPTFVVGYYGMNFKNIQEYDWAYGYQYGLALVVLSALIPALWFKAKRWW